jgi:hypothetical protein
MESPISGIIVLKNFINQSSAADIVSYLDKITRPSGLPFINSALGLDRERSEKISRECPIIDISNDEESNSISRLVTDLIFIIKENMEEYFDTKLQVSNCLYNAMHPGSHIAYHADSAHLEEGEWVEEPESPTEFSALLYLNEDYEGGELSFEGVDLKPEIGTLVYFKGDHTRPHEVKEVRSGVRKNIVLFYRKPDSKGDYNYFPNEND